VGQGRQLYGDDAKENGRCQKQYREDDRLRRPAHPIISNEHQLFQRRTGQGPLAEVSRQRCADHENDDSYQKCPTGQTQALELVC
jgi:hypothetical protein